MKSRSRRLGAFISAGVAAALLLAGCSSTSGGTGGTTGGTLQVQTGFASGSPLLKELTTLANAYTKKHPSVKFNLIPSTANYEQTLKVDLAAHNAPDIWMTHGWSRDRYSQFLVNLQSQAWNKKVNPALDSAMRSSSGAIYALPLDTDVSGIVYNEDVLKKAGIDPATLKTWSAFNAASAKIKAMGITPVEVSEKANGPAGNLIDWIAPGMYTTSALGKLKKGTFVDADYQPMLDQISTWSKNGFINSDYTSATQDDMSRALANGTAAFVFQQNAVATQAFVYNPNAKLGFFPIPSNSPSSTNGKPYLLGGEMDAFGVSNTSKLKQDGIAFLDFLAQPANEAAMAKAAGAIPGLTTAKATQSTILDSYTTWVTKGKTPLEPYFDRVYLPNGAWNTVVTTADSVITGQATPAAATGQMATQFKSLYGTGN